MATLSGQIRQGLPRVPGGEAWPPAGEVPFAVQVATPAEPSEAVVETGAEVSTQGPETVPTQSAEPEAAIGATQVAPPSQESSSGPAVSTKAALRSGLPRVAGGDPWPAGGELRSDEAPQPTAPEAALHTSPDSPKPEKVDPAVATPPSADTPSVLETEPASTPATATLGDTPLRRGLPRHAGGDAWPAEGFAPAATATTPVQSREVPSEPVLEDAVKADVVISAEPVEPAKEVASPAPVVAPVATPVVEEPAPEQKIATVGAPTSTPSSPTPRSPIPSAPAESTKPVKPLREPVMIGTRTLGQWVKLGVLGALGAIAAAAVLVLAARGVTTLPGVPAFLERYPGEYELPEAAAPGFPWWAQWTHFLNFFLIVLIIRSGWQVRTQQQPPAFWTPKRGGKKVSINLWLHQSLDVLWVSNGLIFIVLLFVSGHWMRIVPTSWQVFPNAASALLQYMTLDWPTDNGWVNYNSLQQIMYFLVVFIAAPLAIITGIRMSEWWPEKADRLNKIYPAPLARAVHFPVMLFFVLFIIIHVFLVFATGALRNLNHMFGGTDVVNWTGFWLFAAAIAVTAAGWFAARPLIVAPIANLFGKVSNR